MTKSEYIARYGEEKYREYLRYCSVKRREAYIPKTAKRKSKYERVDNIQVKVYAVVDTEKGIIERNKDEVKLASLIQKRLRSWWHKQTDKQFILIVEAGSVVNHSAEYPFRVELTQLNLHEEEIKQFKLGAVEVVKDILRNNF